MNSRRERSTVASRAAAMSIAASALCSLADRLAIDVASSLSAAHGSGPGELAPHGNRDAIRIAQRRAGAIRNVGEADEHARREPDAVLLNPLDLTQSPGVVQLIVDLDLASVDEYGVPLVERLNPHGCAAFVAVSARIKRTASNSARRVPACRRRQPSANAHPATRQLELHTVEVVQRKFATTLFGLRPRAYRLRSSFTIASGVLARGGGVLGIYSCHGRGGGASG